jgi:hypothetical protein
MLWMGLEAVLIRVTLVLDTKETKIHRTPRSRVWPSAAEQTFDVLGQY